MEYYDIIIIGAGIAGCGLAYNLKRIRYKGKILIIDKKEIGANAGYGYRNTFKEVVKEYDLSYIHKYKGLKIGSLEEPIATLNTPFYFINYSKNCKSLFKRSHANIKKEQVLDIKKSQLKTNKSDYKFKYLIDCSGPHMFLKRKLRMKLPIRYFMGELMEFDNSQGLNSDYFYFNVDNNSFLEDIYPLDKKIFYGTWRYVKKINFKKIHPLPEKNYCKTNSIKINNLKKNYAMQTVSPAFPLIHKNYAFLGDSFGSATPSVGEGIAPILKSSMMLAKAIKKSNLKLYEKEWKKEFLSIYLKHLAFKMNPNERIKTIKLLKSHEKVILSIIKNKDIKIPTHIKKQISKKTMIKQLYNLTKLRIRYTLTRRI